MSIKPRCLVRGSINIDEFFALPHIVKPGETISSTSFTRRAGGKGANQAYAVAKAGGAVDLDGCVGTDGRWIRDNLQKGGVGVDRLRIIEEEVTGRAIIQSASDGENSIVLHKGANFHIPPSDTHPDLSPYTHLLLQNEIPLKSTMDHLQSQNLISIFNPSPMLTPQELRAFPWKSLSWLIVNEGELETLLDSLSGSPTRLSEDLVEDARARIRAIHKAENFDGVSIICTLGAAGILYYKAGAGAAEDIPHLPAGKLVNGVKDTTGAGDCFAGYFAAGLMRLGEEGLEEVLKTCLTACAICVESPGAMDSYPSFQEVQARSRSD